ncbi:MAG TPA: hypothetical protein VF614_05715 [Chthoniobacteraceae bacterium]|jgi:hypothetical protein
MFILHESHGMPLDEPLVLPVSDVPAWEAAHACGIDVAMLYHNALAPLDERLRGHASALSLARRMRAGKLQADGQL